MTSLPINIRKPQLSLGDKAGTATINASLAELQVMRLTGNIALEVGGSGKVGLVITQDGTGGHTVTFDEAVLAVDPAPGAATLVEIWPGGEVVYPGTDGGGGTPTPVTWDTLVKPAVIAAGGTAAAARAAIGAGTSNLALGVTDATAAAGDHTHTAAAVGAAPSVHTHSIGAVTGLQEALDAAAASGGVTVVVDPSTTVGLADGTLIARTV